MLKHVRGKAFLLKCEVWTERKPQGLRSHCFLSVSPARTEEAKATRHHCFLKKLHRLTKSWKRSAKATLRSLCARRLRNTNLCTYYMGANIHQDEEFMKWILNETAKPYWKVDENGQRSNLKPGKEKAQK